MLKFFNKNISIASTGRFYATLVTAKTPNSSNQQQPPHQTNASSKPQLGSSSSSKITSSTTTEQQPILNSTLKTQISKSGKLYNENEMTPGLEQFIEKSRIIRRELQKSPFSSSDSNNIDEINENTKLQNDTDASLKTLLIRSVTHASYGTGKVRSQERLSFIGSFVLNMILTEIISQKYMVNSNETNCGRENFNTVNLIKSIYNNRSFLAFIVANQYWNLSNQYKNDIFSNDNHIH